MSTEKHPFEPVDLQGAPTERHPFEPFLPEGARMLFLGSFPPQPHRWCMPFYYPNWINDFWRIMGLIHFGDKDRFCIVGEKRFDEAAIREFCTGKGLAFYDTACEVRRLKDNASDAFLEVVTATDIASLLLKMPYCNTLITTGQKATEIIAQTFRCPVPPVGDRIDLDIPIPDQISSPSTLSDSGSLINDAIPDSGWAFRSIRFWRMPSTSRAYPLPLEKKAAAYRRLFFEDAAC